MARPGRFTDEDIVSIRTIYANARRSSEELDPADEDYETVLDTEERLATAFRVSRSMIRRIVIGLAYADAGGPIDEQRQAADRASREEVNATELTVTRPGGNPKVFIYPGGTDVRVRAVVADLSRYNNSGLPTRGGDTDDAGPPAASRPTKVARPPQRTAADPAADAAKRQRDEIARLKERLADPTTPAMRRSALQNKLDRLLYRGDAPDSAGNASGNI